MCLACRTSYVTYHSVHHIKDSPHLDEVPSMSLGECMIFNAVDDGDAIAETLADLRIAVCSAQIKAAALRRTEDRLCVA